MEQNYAHLEEGTAEATDNKHDYNEASKDCHNLTIEVQDRWNKVLIPNNWKIGALKVLSDKPYAYLKTLTN